MMCYAFVKVFCMFGKLKMANLTSKTFLYNHEDISTNWLLKLVTLNISVLDRWLMLCTSVAWCPDNPDQIHISLSLTGLSPNLTRLSWTILFMCAGWLNQYFTHLLKFFTRTKKVRGQIEQLTFLTRWGPVQRNVKRCCSFTGVPLWYRAGEKLLPSNDV